MRLKSIQLDSSSHPGRIRVVGEVVYDDRPTSSEQFWFEYPQSYGQDLSTSGNPFLSCLSLLAMKIGEPLVLNATVDRIHLENTKELMRIFKCWFPKLHLVPVEGAKVEESPVAGGNKTLSFFSSGIDSSFSLLYHNGGMKIADVGLIEEIGMILGFDIPLENKGYYQRKLDRTRKLAETFHVDILDITTNIRETRIKDTNWGFLTHGGALAAAALCLEKRYRRVLIPSTGGYADMSPWASHVLTDPLFSTSTVSFHHDAAEFDREEKCVYLAKSPELMKTLHVCNNSFTDENCVICEKCLRSLVVFDILGELDKCTSFDLSLYQPERIRKIYMKYDYIYFTWEQIKNLAQKHNRKDVVRLIDDAFKFDKKTHRQLDFLNRYRNSKFLWRFSQHWSKEIERKVVS